MKYIRKICPVCGNEFVVQNTAEERAIYCTLRCLLESEDKMNENKLSFLRCQCDLIA